MPVIMVSSLTERGCQIALQALELGALDFVTKPTVDVARGTAALGDEIVAKVRAARSARIRPRRAEPAAASAPPPRTVFKGSRRIVAVGSSTGGTEALREVLTGLPADSPGLVIVQHMPAGFTRAFATRLDGLCRIRVAEARDGDRVLPGTALLAPGNEHMELVRSGAEYRVRIFTEERVNHHRPSVDVLFHSCARAAGQNAVGVILTGMGNDGARGMLAMRQAGARTIAQDEATSVVFGMPREAIALGGAEYVEPLPHIAAKVLGLAG